VEDEDYDQAKRLKQEIDNLYRNGGNPITRGGAHGHVPQQGGSIQGASVSGQREQNWGGSKPSGSMYQGPESKGHGGGYYAGMGDAMPAPFGGGSQGPIKTDQNYDVSIDRPLCVELCLKRKLRLLRGNPPKGRTPRNP